MTDRRDKWDARYRNVDVAAPPDPSQTLLEVEPGLKPGDALDLACGVGRNALYLARRRWRVQAVDFSEVAISQGRQFAASENLSVDWLVRDLNVWRPTPARFALVIIYYLHLPHPQMSRILVEAERAVRPGGLLLVVGHHLDNIEAGTGGPKHADVAHTPEIVTEMLEQLEVIRAERREQPADHGRRHDPDLSDRLQIDSLVLARAV